MYVCVGGCGLPRRTIKFPRVVALMFAHISQIVVHISLCSPVYSVRVYICLNNALAFVCFSAVTTPRYMHEHARAHARLLLARTSGGNAKFIRALKRRRRHLIFYLHNMRQGDAGVFHKV